MIIEQKWWESWKKRIGASYIRRWVEGFLRIINFPVIPGTLTSSLKSFDTFRPGFGPWKNHLSFFPSSNCGAEWTTGFFAHLHGPRLGSKYFFPCFPMSTSHLYDPPSCTPFQLLISPLATSSSFTSQPFLLPRQQLSASSCRRLADIPPQK